MSGLYNLPIKQFISDDEKTNKANNVSNDKECLESKIIKIVIFQ